MKSIARTSTKSALTSSKPGKVPIYEEHLDEVLKRAVADKKISYTSNAGDGIRTR